MFTPPKLPRMAYVAPVCEPCDLPSAFTPRTNEGAAVSVSQVDGVYDSRSCEDVLSQAKTVPFGSRLAKSACVERFLSSDSYRDTLSRWKAAADKLPK